MSTAVPRVRESDCVFCEIVGGRAPSYRVLEDVHAVAFLNIRPAAPGHTLVVPRVHARDMWEISEVSHGHVAAMAHRVAALLNATLAPDGVNVKHNTGEAAGQDVFHFHAHVVPRWHGDNLRLAWNSPLAQPAELEEVLERVSAGR
ncbi:histidine triad (HIT) protein [Catenulispora acidiphila DSM 44928]|uniref:Histidine triad (HIT) protein n=1 Tax=Catenulispora acidiphila (strain DSM 44928 / JCM 14897 / NBRC 102108 / NRRL B-24433 / ID139908) TaxID=479433 RepID=C7QBS5_CATAD|nr:histidine triad (HIT) protein [Catenulispora acidiphila DSM 44928]